MEFVTNYIHVTLMEYMDYYNQIDIDIIIH